MSIAGMVALGAAGVPGFSQMFGFSSTNYFTNNNKKEQSKSESVSKYKKGDRLKCVDKNIYEVEDVVFDTKGECYLLRRVNKFPNTKIWVRLEFIVGV